MVLQTVPVIVCYPPFSAPPFVKSVTVKWRLAQILSQQGALYNYVKCSCRTALVSDFSFYKDMRGERHRRQWTPQEADVWD